MRNYSKTIGALAAASTLVAGSASAELEGEVHVGYANMYEFRFYDVGDSLFEAGVDLAYDAGPVTLTGGAWYGGWDNRNGAIFVAPDSELDLYAGIGTEFGPVSLELGYIYYAFPGFSAFDTQEVYLSAGVDLFWDVSLNSTAFWDFDLYDGLYVDTSISKSFQFNECLALDLAVGFGYADGHGLQIPSNVFSVGSKDGYQGYYVSAQLPWEFRDGVTLTPYVKYTDGDNGLATGPNFIDSGNDYFIAGVKLGVAF
jgi:uncharacterized protein (TIGR02001 family)